MSVYIVDANFFIQAHRFSYPLDVFPSFWTKVKHLAEEGKIISIDKVRNEIFKNEDELKTWCHNNLPANFFHDTSITLSEYANIVAWAVTKSNHYMPKALAEFLDVDEADAWLIAFGLRNVASNIIVTHETSEPLRRSKVKIPDVCLSHGVSYMNTIDMFRKLGESL